MSSTYKVKLLRRWNRQRGRMYPVYFIHIPRKVVETMGNVKGFEMKLKTVDGRLALVLYPIE